MSYGHGISVSLLQVARAYTVFTNDGKLLPLSLTKLQARIGDRSVRGTKNPNERSGARTSSFR